eukprot:6580577-Pyramimonas_sp.AAC.1
MQHARKIVRFLIIRAPVGAKRAASVIPQPEGSQTSSASFHPSYQRGTRASTSRHRTRTKHNQKHAYCFLHSSECPRQHRCSFPMSEQYTHDRVTRLP